MVGRSGGSVLVHLLLPPSRIIYTTMEEVLIKIRKATDEERMKGNTKARYFHLDVWFNRAKIDRVITALDDNPKADYSFFCSQKCEVDWLIETIREQNHLL